MQARGLIDTGAIVALLDADDLWHDRCREALRTLRLPLATIAAVLVEVFHLLDHHPSTARQKFLSGLKCGIIVGV